MPQLDTTTFSSQLFWLGVCFFVLYCILSYILVPKIVGILERRSTLREQKINQASTYREHAEGLMIDYERTLAQARKNAHKHYQSVTNATALEIGKKKQDLLDKLQDRLHVAEQKLYRARIEVGAHMGPIAQEIAAEILQKLTGHTYSADQLVEKGNRE